MNSPPEMLPANAVFTVKIDSVVRLLAVMCAFMLWYSLALVALVLYLARPGPLEHAFQVLTAIGLAPLAAVIATKGAMEWLLVEWMQRYARKHIERF